MDYTNLSESTIDSCTLERIDLRNSNLSFSTLKNCSMSDIMLWNTQIGGWRLVNVACASAFFDEHSDQRVNFVDGQFERLYGGALRVHLSFDGGIIASELRPSQ
jgi:uncharacterized protein YjbI with pentapeptide repeats